MHKMQNKNLTRSRERTCSARAQPPASRKTKKEDYSSSFSMGIERAVAIAHLSVESETAAFSINWANLIVHSSSNPLARMTSVSISSLDIFVISFPFDGLSISLCTGFVKRFLKKFLIFFTFVKLHKFWEFFIEIFVQNVN